MVQNVKSNKQLLIKKICINARDVIIQHLVNLI